MYNHRLQTMILDGNVFPHIGLVLTSNIIKRKNATLCYAYHTYIGRKLHPSRLFWNNTRNRGPLQYKVLEDNRLSLMAFGTKTELFTRCLRKIFRLNKTANV